MLVSDDAAQRPVNESDAPHDTFCKDAVSAQALSYSQESWVPILRSTGGTFRDPTASLTSSASPPPSADRLPSYPLTTRTFTSASGVGWADDGLLGPRLAARPSCPAVPKWADRLVFCWQRIISFCPHCCSVTGADKELSSDTEDPLEGRVFVRDRPLSLPLSYGPEDNNQHPSKTAEPNAQEVSAPGASDLPIHSRRRCSLEPDGEEPVERHEKTPSDTGSLELMKPARCPSFHWPGTPTPIGISILSLIWILGAENQLNTGGEQIFKLTKLPRLLVSFCIVYVAVWAVRRFFFVGKEVIAAPPPNMLQYNVAGPPSRPLAPSTTHCAAQRFVSPPSSPVKEVNADAAGVSFSTHAGDALPRHNQRQYQHDRKPHIPPYWKKKEGEFFPILVQATQKDPFLRRVLKTLVHPEVCGTDKSSVVKQLYEWWRASDSRPLLPPEHWKLRPLHISSTMSQSEFEYCSIRLLLKHYPRACLQCWPPEYIKTGQRSLGANPRIPTVRFPFVPKGLVFTQKNPPPDGSVSSTLSVKGKDCILIPIVNEFFEGNLLVRIRGLGETGCMSYFSGRKRLTQLVVQGRFKEAIPFNSVISGQVCELPWKSLPPTWLMNLVLSFVAVMFPSFQADLTISKPYFLFPLVTSLQVMNIVHPGTGAAVNIPDICDVSLQEDVSLLGGPFADPTWGKNAKCRRSFFSKLENLSDYAFDPRYVYTMETYQHLLDVTNYVVNLPLRSVDLTQYMNGQPIEFSSFVERRYASLFRVTPDCRSKEPNKYMKEHDQLPEGASSVPDRSFVWRIKLWHENLLR